MRKCMGSAMSQITLKYTDVSLTSVVNVVIVVSFFKFHCQPRKKKKEENNSYCGLPAVNKMALTERKGANSESDKEHLQDQGVSI